MSRRTGACLCGVVRIDAEIPETTFLACHCVQCQRWTGGGPLYSIKAEAVEIAGADNITEHKASEWGARGFCRVCGSTLYWKMQDRGIDSLAVGVLDDQSDLSLAEEIFVDYRACWMQPEPAASQSTEAQEFQKLADYQAAKETE
ncbi:MAG: GFA family protein [Pseudomonadota bacterium]